MVTFIIREPTFKDCLAVLGQKLREDAEKRHPKTTYMLREVIPGGGEVKVIFDLRRKE